MVLHWTRIEMRALRQARRMSVREFAAHLGVSDRVVSKWEAGRAQPRPVSQAALDESLSRATTQERLRFTTLVRSNSVPDPR